MPSTYSLRFRLNLQASGENLNTWGAILNAGVFQLIEDALAKRVAFALSGAKTLTTANGAADEARCAFLDVTSGAGGTITAPSVEKLYLVRNGATGDVVLTTGAGTDATFKPGEIAWAVGDGSNFRKALATDFGGAEITGAADPTQPQSLATKAYVDAQLFGAAAGNLPGQPGNAGRYLKTDGATATWDALTVADIPDAAPLASPSFTGGVNVAGGQTVAGGFDFSGLAAFNVAAVAAANVDLTAGPGFTKSISANTTFTFSGALPDEGCGFVLKLTITSAAVDTWPASVKFENGIKPTLGNGTHYLSFITLDSGTTWLMKAIGRAVGP